MKQRKMTNRAILNQLVAKRIGETLEILEMSGMDKKQLGIIRKAMWRIADEIILTKKVSDFDRINKKNA
jgi:hypothetical protein